MGGFALAASAGWNLANVGAVAGRTSAAYGVGLAVVGLFTTALVLTHAAMQIPAGRFCDRFGARVVGAVGVAVILCASLAGLALREAWFAILVRLVTGLGLAGAFVGGADYVRATLRSPLAQGFYGAASMASAGLAGAVRHGCDRRRRQPRADCDRTVRRAARRGRASRTDLRSPTGAARCHARGVVRPLRRDRQLGRHAARARRRRVGARRRSRRWPGALPGRDLTTCRRQARR